MYCSSVHVAVVIAHDAFQGVHAGFLRRHAVAHVFNNGVSARDLDVFFPAAGRASGTHVLIGVAACADDGRIADTGRASLNARPLVVVHA